MRARARMGGMHAGAAAGHDETTRAHTCFHLTGHAETVVRLPACRTCVAQLRRERQIIGEPLWLRRRRGVAQQLQRRADQRAGVPARRQQRKRAHERARLLVGIPRQQVGAHVCRHGAGGCSGCWAKSSSWVLGMRRWVLRKECAASSQPPGSLAGAQRGAEGTQPAGPQLLELALAHALLHLHGRECGWGVWLALPLQADRGGPETGGRQAAGGRQRRQQGTPLQRTSGRVALIQRPYCCTCRSRWEGKSMVCSSESRDRGCERQDANLPPCCRRADPR